MATKRRAGHATSPDFATPEPKRARKRNDDTFFPDHETVATTQELGAKIIKLLKKSTDKGGRLISTNFLELPDRDEYPDYYDHIALPLSLLIIEKNLNDGQYGNMESLESDLKRMVQNAKDYNDSKSAIFEDAERIRKALSNFMPKHNPAYLNEEYRAYPTPIPQHLQDQMAARVANGRSSAESTKVKLVFNKPGRRRQSQAASTDGEDDAAENEAVFTEVLDDLSAQENAINFEEKPSRRDVPADYYKIIKRPLGINDVRNMVRRGKITDWPTLASEVRQIWDNAKEYNEPESEIYEIAESLETYSEAKFQQHGVPPRTSTKITLSAPKPTQLKLKIGASTPGFATPLVAGTSVDDEALMRQREETAQALSRATRGASRGYTNGTTSAPAIPTSLRRSVSISETNGVQSGTSVGQTQQAPALQPSSMPAPPAGPSNVPTPVMAIESSQQQPALTNGYAVRAPYQQTLRNVRAESDNPIDRNYRDPGKTADDALIGSVTYMTHPKLPNDPKWKITRYASDDKTQTSYYIYLPSNHSYIRLIPTLTSEFASRRSRKMVVTHNWSVVQPAVSMQPGVLAYEFGLNPGENTIAVDAIADLKEGERKDYAPPQLQIDFERITFFIYLRDSTD